VRLCAYENLHFRRCLWHMIAMAQLPKALIKLPNQYYRASSQGLCECVTQADYDLVASKVSNKCAMALVDILSFKPLVTPATNSLWFGFERRLRFYGGVTKLGVGYRALSLSVHLIKSVSLYFHKEKEKQLTTCPENRSH
jgi:hypothetical protein